MQCFFLLVHAALRSCKNGMSLNARSLTMCTNGYHGTALGALLMIHIVQIVRLERGGRGGNIGELYSLILANILYSLSVGVRRLRGVFLSYSESRNRWYSSSPTFTGLPPYYHPRQRNSPITSASPYLRYQNVVTLLHTHGQSVTGLVERARTSCEYFCLV